MEAKGKEAFFTLEPLEANCKLTLGDGEGVPQVELAVHVGVGEGHHVPEQEFVAHTLILKALKISLFLRCSFRSIIRSILFEDFQPVPVLLALSLNVLQELDLERSLTFGHGCKF